MDDWIIYFALPSLYNNKDWPKFPIHGTRQGSANSPVIWSLLSTRLSDAYNTKSHGMTFTCTDGHFKSLCLSLNFDDSTVITLSPPDASFDKLLKRLCSDAQLWHDLLWCSRGKLELPKYGFHLMYYDFTYNLDYPSDMLPRILHTTGDIFLTDPQGHPVRIVSKNMYTPRKNLGHHKHPCVFYSTELSTFLSKADTICSSIQQCCPNVHIPYKTVLHQAIECPLAWSFSASAQQLQLKKKYFPCTYSLCSYARSTVMAILHTPTTVGGEGFVPLTGSHH